VSRGLRLALFGDGAWAADTLSRIQHGPHEVAAVVLRRSPSDGTLEAVARDLGLPVLQPANVNTSEMVDSLRGAGVELGLSVAYDQIFRPMLLEAAPLGFLNLHAGMLPFYRGRNVINWALINGEREIGVTIHFLDQGVDTGDILLQRSMPVGWTDTYRDVLCRVVQVAPEMISEALDLVAGGVYERRPQPAIGTYYGGRGEGDEWLTWSDPSERLHNKVRAISQPGPGARTLLGDRVITIWRAHFDPAWPRYRATPGEVVGRSREGAVVKTGDSTLLVQEVQEHGREPECPRWPIGSRLGENLSAVVAALQERLRRSDQARR